MRKPPEKVTDVNRQASPGTFARESWSTMRPSELTAKEIVPLGVTVPVYVAPGM
jgi:hypothetical protein